MRRALRRLLVGGRISQVEAAKGMVVKPLDFIVRGGAA
jgi:hypothetical protein